MMRIINNLFYMGLSLAITLLAIVVLFIGSIFISNIANAGDIELKEVSINFRKYFPGGRDPLITQNGLENRTLGEELNLNVNTNLASYFYWNNRVHSMTDRYADTGKAGQFRLIGWNFNLGIRISEHIDFGYQHFSRHLLDHTYQHGGWPVQDSLEITIYLYGRKERGDSLF